MFRLREPLYILYKRYKNCEEGNRSCELADFGVLISSRRSKARHNTLNTETLITQSYSDLVTSPVVAAVTNVRYVLSAKKIQ